jgi:hypothetical protein
MSSRLRSKTMILIGGLLIIVLSAGGSGVYLVMKNNNHKSLVNEYNNGFCTIQAASATFKTQLDVPPTDIKTPQGIITFYKDLTSKNTFEAQVKELNNNPKYTSLQANEKKGPEVLDLDKATTQLGDRLKDIEKLQSILQRSTNLDTEISDFVNKINSSDYDYYGKSEDISKRNSGLKDEMLSLVISDKFKEVQFSFAQALNSRGNAIDELRKTYNSLDSYRWSVKSFDRYMNTMNENLKQAQQVPDSQFGSYITSAYEQVRWAKQGRTNMDEKWNDATKHKAEFDKLAASYLELIGLPIADTSKLTLKQDVRPSISDELATIFIQDYLRKGIMALSKKNFYIVQPYLDKDGKKYWEQFGYMDYLQKNGISESLTSVETKSVEPIDTNYMKITVSEKYDITYGDGTHKIKTFTSDYKLTKSSADSFLINELMTTKEVESIDK